MTASYWDQPLPPVGARIEYEWNLQPYGSSLPVPTALNGVPIAGSVRGTVVGSDTYRGGLTALCVDLDQPILDRDGAVLCRQARFAPHRVRRLSLLEILAEVAQ